MLDPSRPLKFLINPITLLQVIEEGTTLKKKIDTTTPSYDRDQFTRAGLVFIRSPLFPHIKNDCLEGCDLYQVRSFREAVNLHQMNEDVFDRSSYRELEDLST